MDEYGMFGNMENASKLNIIHIKLIKRTKIIYILNTELSSDSTEIDLSQIQTEESGWKRNWTQKEDVEWLYQKQPEFKMYEIGRKKSVSHNASAFVQYTRIP